MTNLLSSRQISILVNLFYVWNIFWIQACELKFALCHLPGRSFNKNHQTNGRIEIMSWAGSSRHKPDCNFYLIFGIEMSAQAGSSRLRPAQLWGWGDPSPGRPRMFFISVRHWTSEESRSLGLPLNISVFL